MTNEQIRHLIQRLINGTASEEEVRQLLLWINNKEVKEEIRNRIESFWKADTHEKYLHETDWEAMYQSIVSNPVKEKVQPRIVSRIWRYAAAAVLLIGIGSGIYFLVKNKPQNDTIVAENNPVLNDTVSGDALPPVHSNAILRLPGGQTIPIDSIQNGSMTVRDIGMLKKLEDGSIEYLPAENIAAVQWNTLEVPRGGGITSFTLSDGTRFWANAGSVIKFPARFSGDERRVEITGEVYFEVTKQTRKKFIVQAKDHTVEVLGTHFNISAYDDDDLHKITLLEGSVKVSNSFSSKLLSPGEQAQLKANSRTIVAKNVDALSQIAWKNGEFYFGDKQDLKTIMRQIARWYDIEVEYAGDANQLLGGAISRNVKLLSVLKMLEKAGGVTFKTEGKKVIVMP